MPYINNSEPPIVENNLHWLCNVDEPPLFYFLFFFSQDTLDGSSVFFFR